MVNVCLDQCAISELAKAKGTTSATSRLRDELLEGADGLQLICPVALETIVETTGIFDAKLRLEIHALHSALADARLGGPIWAFKSMWKLIKEETLALARCQRPPFPFEIIRWSRVADDQLAAQTWTGVQEAKARMVARVENHELNRINGPVTLDVTSQRIVLQHAAHVFRQIDRALAGQPLEPADHMGYGVVEFLQQQGVTKAEFEKLKEDIIHHRWEAIPVIFNRTRLAGQLEADYRSKEPRKYDVNHELDIPRVAVGLSHADLVITDAGMWELCRKIKTPRWTETHVFAVRHGEEIIKRLDGMLSVETGAT